MKCRTCGHTFNSKKNFVLVDEAKKPLRIPICPKCNYLATKIELKAGRSYRVAVVLEKLDELEGRREKFVEDELVKLGKLIKKANWPWEVIGKAEIEKNKREKNVPLAEG